MDRQHSLSETACGLANFRREFYPPGHLDAKRSVLLVGLGIGVVRIFRKNSRVIVVLELCGPLVVVVLAVFKC